MITTEAAARKAALQAAVRVVADDVRAWMSSLTDEQAIEMTLDNPPTLADIEGHPHAAAWLLILSPENGIGAEFQLSELVTAETSPR